ncbi:hypothetical protein CAUPRSCDRAFT_11755 [Caulochytrium protostelioides]|uniref:Uncharacterized protein n=1 Tax=Caulochytrium protostelioides TaxID=1555241 RepID=A0A4P9WW48_9FUNG|nr:hypothetical protein CAUPRSCDRAFT_11755 [Caulochytrium protostelioides]
MGYAPSSAYSDTGASSMERSGVHGPSRPGSDVSSEWSHGTASPMQVGDRGISLGVSGHANGSSHGAGNDNSTANGGHGGSGSSSSGMGPPLGAHLIGPPLGMP